MDLVVDADVVADAVVHVHDGDYVYGYDYVQVHAVLLRAAIPQGCC